MDPYDPSRFLSPAQPPSENSKRHVRFRSGSLSSEQDVQEEQSTSRRSSQSSKKSSTPPTSNRSYTFLLIMCSAFAMGFGMWAGPTLFATDGPLAQAFTSATTARLPTPPHTLFRHQQRGSRSVPAYITTYVQKAIRAATRDPVGRRDFALAADGAKIAHKLTSSFDLLSDLSPSSRRPPELVLDEDMRMTSHWLLPVARGQVGIKLPAFIYPTQVTIDHIPRELAANIQQAPRHMVLWGLVEGSGNEQRRLAYLEQFQMSPLNSTGSAPPISNNGTFLPLAAFEYAINGDSNVQTFAVDPTVIASRVYFGAVVLEIRTNWGAPSTRLYRVRIHGDEVSQ